MYAEIPALIEQGRTKVEIAERFGVTPSTLAVQCSRRGISLSKSGPRGRRRTLTLPEAPLDLSDVVMVGLREKARAMGTDAVKLARDLLEAIVADDLYAAVLDLEVAA
jgi:transposase-like protein